MNRLLSIITATDPAERNRSLDSAVKDASLEELLADCDELDAFRRQSDHLYQRVRALFFLYAIHRFHLPTRRGLLPRTRAQAAPACSEAW